MSTIIEKLEQHQPATPSRWREKAEFRQAHKKLLRTLQQKKMQLLDEIEKARQEYKEGKGVSLKSHEDIDRSIESL
jgi:hypothetical protein